MISLIFNDSIEVQKYNVLVYHLGIMKYLVDMKPNDITFAFQSVLTCWGSICNRSPSTRLAKRICVAAETDVTHLI